MTQKDRITRLATLRSLAVDHHFRLNPRLKKDRQPTAPPVIPPARTEFAYNFELEKRVLARSHEAMEVAKWFWRGDARGGSQNTWVEYDAETSARLEAAHDERRCLERG